MHAIFRYRQVHSCAIRSSVSPISFQLQQLAILILVFAVLSSASVSLADDGSGEGGYFQKQQETRPPIQKVPSVELSTKSIATDLRDSRLPPVLPGESVERGGKRHKVISTVGPVPVAPVPPAPAAPLAPSAPTIANPIDPTGAAWGFNGTSPGAVSVIIDRTKEPSASQGESAAE
jgi:hypothetical protein